MLGRAGIWPPGRIGRVDLTDRRAIGVVALVLFPLLAIYAWAVYAPCDDTYIFAVYARNLLEGNGLTFNGARVEGFTSTSWVLWGAVLGWLQIPIPFGLEISSSISGGLALLATYALGRGVGLSPRRALLAPCLLAASGDLAFYASNGMDGPIFAAMIAGTLALCAAHEPRELLGSVRFPLVLAILTLTRPEGAWISAVLLILLGFEARSLTAVARCAAIYVVALFPVVLVKRLYYGFWLPNTYYVKADAGLDNLAHGAEYLAEALRSYAPVVGVAALVAALRLWRRDSSRLAVLVPTAAVFGLWVVYVLVQGGDGLIGARMLVPVLPLLYVLTVKLAERVPFRVASAAALVLCALLVWGYTGAERIRVQAKRWRQQAQVREYVGLELRERFPAGTLIATDAAGIIPYQSRLPTIDLLGLNDEHIAHHGRRDRELRVGHQAGDGAYVLSREPKVILFGARAGQKPGKFVSDREIWESREFQDDYVRTSLGKSAWAYVRREP